MKRPYNANWKIVAENYIDVYHLAHLHSNTLQMYDHKNAKFGFIGDHYMFWEPLTPKYQEHLDKLIPTKRIQEMTDEYLGVFVLWLFPNLGLSEGKGSWNIFHAIPLAFDKTKVIIRTKLEPMTAWEFNKQQWKSKMSWQGIIGGDTKYGKKPNPNSEDPMDWNDFMEEDFYVCEQQQKSLNNPLFSVTATAKHGESTIREFQEIVNNWMKK